MHESINKVNGLMIKLMAMGYIIIRMGTLTRGTGRMINSMDLVWKHV